MIQQDHLQIFDLTLNVWAPLFVGNGSSYTKKEYMYNTRNGKVSFLDEQKFFSFLVEHDLVDKYGQFMLSEQSNLWAFLTKDCGISDAELKTLTRYQIEVGDALDAEHSLKEIHAFQRDAQGHAYIPGSSIKGALRTAWLLSAVLADRSTGHSLAQNRRATFPEEKYVNQLHLRTLKDESIASDAVNSIFRGIQVSDSAPIPDAQMVLVGKFDALVNGSFAKGSNRGMHLQGEHPIAHFLCFSPEKQSLIWTVNLLNDAARQVVFPVLESAKEIPLHELTLPVSEVRTFPAISAEELIRSGRSRSETRAKIAFLSPCAFKQSGRYTIFPQETLLLQSLIAHWNAAFPEYALIDSDALQALQQGLHIVDYNLHTTRYLLKETRIPAFQGNVTIEARLAPPLLELWNALLSFASHGGVGIKTTLGMGGAATDFYKKTPVI